MSTARPDRPLPTLAPLAADTTDRKSRLASACGGRLSSVLVACVFLLACEFDSGPLEQATETATFAISENTLSESLSERAAVALSSVSPEELRLERRRSACDVSHWRPVQGYDGPQAATVSRRHLAAGILIGGCMATLVAPDLVLTAGHCAPTVHTGRRPRHVVFITASNVCIAKRRVLEVLALEHSDVIDFALLRIQRVTSIRPTPLRMRALSVGEPLIIMGSGTGRSSTKSVDVTAHVPQRQPLVVGGVRYSNSYFEHRLSRHDGISGAGILDRNGRLVGIHVGSQCRPEHGILDWHVSAYFKSIFMRSNVISSHLPYAPLLWDDPLQEIDPARDGCN